MTIPQLDMTRNRGSYPSIGHFNGNARHRGQYKHGITLNTWCMDPIQ